MRPNSEINEVHTAHLAHSYGRVAAYLLDPDPARRRSYAPYIGPVCELNERSESITFQSECLLPRNDRGRPRVLLLFSNAQPESIKNGMFYAAEGKVAALWTDLCHVDLFSGDRTILGSPDRLRSHCINLTYEGPFALGFTCYWIFPTFHPDHLKSLFGRHMEPPGFEDTKRRLDQLLEKWQPSAIISFNAKVFEALKGVTASRYTKRLHGHMIQAQCHAPDHEYLVFETYPAGWRFDRDAARLRQDMLRRIADAIQDNRGR